MPLQIQHTIESDTEGGARMVEKTGHQSRFMGLLGNLDEGPVPGEERFMKQKGH